MSFEPDLIILGAGAAGLAAAADLVSAGLKIVIVEARDRIGGRMFTTQDPATKAPIELGAEFIHGRPPEIWTLLRENHISADELEGDTWCVRDGQLRNCDFFTEVDQVLERMSDRGPDESFLEFVQRTYSHAEQNAKQSEAIEWARRYVTGFHAADPALISVHSLVKGTRADEEIEGDRAFRISKGYEALIDLYRRPLTGTGVALFLSHVAEKVIWKRSHVEVSATSNGRSQTFTSSRLLITLPLAVLQASPQQDGSLRFIPQLPSQKQGALEKLVMGKVIRVTHCFRERFWEKLRPPGSRESKTLADLSFLLSQEDWFPTWWTTLPAQLPIITGWAPFQCAERLSGQSNEFVIERSLLTLGKLLGVPRHELENLLQSTYWHDWQNDPLSRGAYSYVRVGGEGAQQCLAMPVDNTLFFAGEATDISGHHGTVHGAIASGKRAAQQILKISGK
jgi:monoamine oxidase